LNKKNRIGFGGDPGAQTTKQLFHGLAARDSYGVGCNFGEGNQNKSALGKARMGNVEAVLVNFLFAKEQDVEVESSWAILDAGRAVAAEFALNPKQVVEENEGRKRSFESHDGVEEAGLIGKTDGRGRVE
jgi:hypothetical protein